MDVRFLDDDGDPILITTMDCVPREGEFISLLIGNKRVDAGVVKLCWVMDDMDDEYGGGVNILLRVDSVEEFDREAYDANSDTEATDV